MILECGVYGNSLPLLQMLRPQQDYEKAQHSGQTSPEQTVVSKQDLPDCTDIPPQSRSPRLLVGHKTDSLETQILLILSMRE